MKICSKCGESKDDSRFGKDPLMLCGLKSQCNDCRNLSYLKWKLKNKERLSAYGKEKRAKNKERIRAYHSKYTKNKMKSDLLYYLSHSIRTRMNLAIKRNQKGGSAVRDLGCSVTEFKKHIESQFQPGMSWENKGKWHIDHIIPLSLFDLTDRTQFLKACNYTNMQPLWAVDNIKKSNKV